MFWEKILSRIYCVNKNYSCHLHVVSSNSAVSLQQQGYVNIVLMLIERPVGFCPSLTISKASTHSMASSPAGRPRPRQPTPAEGTRVIVACPQHRRLQQARCRGRGQEAAGGGQESAGCRARTGVRAGGARAAAAVESGRSSRGVDLSPCSADTGPAAARSSSSQHGTLQQPSTRCSPALPAATPCSRGHVTHVTSRDT